MVNEKLSCFPGRLASSKKGVSAVVATVLIILIVVAAIGILWVAVVPMLDGNLDTQEFDTQLTIDTLKGFTSYDPLTDVLSVQVRRGADDSNLVRIQIGWTVDGEGDSANFATPGVNQEKTYYITNIGAKPEKVFVAPVFGYGSREEVKTATSQVDNLADGSKVLGSGDSYYDGGNGKYVNIWCTIASECEDIAKPYCVDEQCVACTQDTFMTDCDDGNECTDERCYSDVCSWLNEPQEKHCTDGFCDGQGNCGECNVAENCVDKECNVKSCDSNACVYSPVPEGDVCTDGFCDGAGNCAVALGDIYSIYSSTYFDWTGTNNAGWFEYYVRFIGNDCVAVENACSQINEVYTNNCWGDFYNCFGIADGFLMDAGGEKICSLGDRFYLYETQAACEVSIA